MAATGWLKLTDGMPPMAPALMVALVSEMPINTVTPKTKTYFALIYLSLVKLLGVSGLHDG